MGKQTIILGRYLSEYKEIQKPDDYRKFYESYDKYNLKELVLAVKQDKMKFNEFSVLDQYYINEMLLTFDYFKYIDSLLKMYRLSGPTADLEEKYANFSDENLNRIELYLAKRMLTNPEELILTALAGKNFISKNYECERIDLLLNMPT